MQKLRPVLVLLVVLGLLWFWQAPPSPSGPATTPAAGAPESIHADTLPAFLPTEAADTIRLIRRGGPYPNRQDGSVFQHYRSFLRFELSR